MRSLVLQLFGGFRLTAADGKEIKVTSRKARALLAYLACQENAQSRDRVAALLWEEADEEQARTSLRQALSGLRKLLPSDTQSALLADGDSLFLDAAGVDSDVARVNRALDAGTRAALESAVREYRGDLLDGFDARSGAFAEWLGAERRALRRRIVEALQRLLAQSHAAADTAAAIAFAARLTVLEPVNEAAHRALMELHARRHEHTEALHQYKLCRDILRRELDVAPEPATEALYRELLRRRRAGAVHVDTVVEAVSSVAVPATMQRELRAELRDAVVLVVRLEGLLELEATLDPEEAHTLSEVFQNRVRQAVNEQGGRADRRVGSSVLAVFGVPTAHGNEAERGVRAAFALLTQPAVELRHPGLSWRAGLAQGQILCGAELFPITGRAAHLAHRLANHAAGGTLLVADEIRNSLGSRADAERCERAETSEGTSDAWRLRGLRAVHADENAAPFVGRHAETALLIASLERCAVSRHGRVVLVRGDAGMGKTRLVAMIRSSAARRNIRVHAAQIVGFGRTFSRGPITTLALSLLGLPTEATSAERAAAIQRLVPAAEVDHSIFLSDLIGAPLTHELELFAGAMDIATRQRGRTRALTQLIETVATRSPCLFIVEDIHWADTEELAHLGEIAAAVAQCPILLIMTTRPEGDPINLTWRARARGCPISTVDLAPLAEDEAQELAAHYADLPADVVTACIRRAAGYPLFLDQLLRTASAGHATLPGSIRALVLARADKLSERDHRALQAASVLGSRCTLAALREMLDCAELEPTALLATGVLRAMAEGGNELQFTHALFRDAVYESLLKSTRRQWHHRAAALFETDDLALRADHLAAADDERAPAAYLSAAQGEHSAWHVERALGLAQKAKATAREPALLRQTNGLLGELLLQLGRTHDALAAYREALDFSHDHTDRGHALFGVAAALRVMDRHEEALDALDHAELALADSDDACLHARIATLRGNLCFPLGRFDDCLRAHSQAHRYAEQARSPIDIARALGGLGDAWYQRGRMRTARDYFERSVAQGRDHALPGVLLANLPMVGVTNTYCGDIAAGRRNLEEALQLARRISDVRSIMLSTLVLASNHLFSGQHTQAHVYGEATLALTLQLGARRFQAETMSAIATALILLGRRDEALSIGEEALQIGRETGMFYCGPVLLSVVARATEDPKRRQQVLAEGEVLLANGCVSHSYFEFYANAIEVSLAMQCWSEARRYAAALESYTQDEPLDWTRLVIERARLLADRGEGKRNEDAWAALKAECEEREILSLTRGLEPAT
jgi:DNA-binding SARP family transcriptional activator